MLYQMRMWRMIINTIVNVIASVFMIVAVVEVTKHASFTPSAAWFLVVTLCATSILSVFNVIIDYFIAKRERVL